MAVRRSPPSLPEQQAAFAAALLADDVAIGDPIGDAMSEPIGDPLGDPFWHAFVAAPAQARQRFAAYQRNLRGNWRAALSASYPVIACLLGAPRFAELADGYRRAYPSRDADLNLYGESFAGFLAAHRVATELSYLPDLARLEWALEALYGASDEPRPVLATVVAKLAAVPAGRQAEVVLVLSALGTEIVSPWPLAEIWQAHQASSVEARDAALAAIDPRPCGNTVLVSRDPAGKVSPQRLSPGEAAFRRACLAGQTLAEALRAALASEPALDVAALLPAWLGRGWIVDLRLAESPAR